ncbi:cytochrome P450 [Streptomyces bluensis]|uniref:cytochrome P450 n=1 Tax=Streptomyces bluensis TaxID=33897 RepID=UPI00332B354F
MSQSPNSSSASAQAGTATPDASSASGGCPFGHGSSDASRLTPIHGPEFTADPRPTYEKLRATGPIAPIEIAPGVHGMITTGYRSALHLLRNNPERFAKDPRNWEALRKGEIPADSPALVMMQPRENALWMDGLEHARLRQAITDSLELVDTHAVAAATARIADALIDAFADRGEADLIGEYAAQLPTAVLIDMFGCPQDTAQRMVVALGKIFDASADTRQANADLEAACLELTTLKRETPGTDVTSWLIEHPARLTDAEMIQTILLLIGAGSDPATNLIGNALLLMIADERFSGDVFTGVQPVSDALDHVLWTDPPMANYCPLYPRQDMTYEGVPLKAGVPILTSFAMANTDPSVQPGGVARAGNNAHLAFSAGVHGCPAPSLARLMCEIAIERLLDRLPDITLARPADQLSRRPGTFVSGWESLPVTFPPVTAAATPAVAPSAQPTGDDVWSTRTSPPPAPTPSAPPAAPSTSTPPAATSTPSPTASAPRARRRWWSFLVRSRRGR